MDATQLWTKPITGDGATATTEQMRGAWDRWIAARTLVLGAPTRMESRMRFVALGLMILMAFAEFRAEVHGKPTIIGCFIRGMDDLDTARCD